MRDASACRGRNAAVPCVDHRRTRVDIFPDVLAGSGPDQANASVATIGGLIHEAWTRRGHGVAKGNGHGVDLTASIPPAVHTASVTFRAPERARAHITEGGQTVWSSSAGFTGGGRVGVTAAEWVSDQGGRMRVDVGPGTCALVFSMRPWPGAGRCKRVHAEPRHSCHT